MLSKQEIAGLRELLARVDSLRVAGMGQLVHVEREQFRALLDIAEAVANAYEGSVDYVEWEDSDRIILRIDKDEGDVMMWERITHRTRVAVLPLAGEAVK